MQLKHLRSALITLRYAPHWLAEREAVRGERKVLAYLAGRPASAAAGRPPEQARMLEELRASHDRRSAEIAGSGVRRLVCALYDRYAKLPYPIRTPVRLAWRAVRAATRSRDGLEPPPRSGPSRLIDPAATVPFGPSFPPPSGTATVAAIIHIYYPDLAAELRAYLEAIPGRVDVFCSTDTLAKRKAILAAFAGWTRGSVEARIAPNRGRDIAPKLIAFRDVYDRYDLVLHLHSKKSPHDSYLRIWRYFVLETLIGDGDAAASILAAFEAEPSVGMIAAQHFFPLRDGITWGPNMDAAQGLARRMGLRIDPGKQVDFPSGSMFWARSAALKPLLDLDLTTADFPTETGQADGTLAHAVERLYFFACEKAGFRWLKVMRSEFALETQPEPALVRTPADLHTFLETRAANLGLVAHSDRASTP